MHNVRTVLAFEVSRTLRKISFWAVTLGVPLFIVAVTALSAVGSISAGERAETASTKEFSYSDASGLIDTALATERQGTKVEDPARAVADVRDGRTAVYIEYPADPSTQPIRIYAQDAGLIENSSYSSLAQDVLRASVQVQLPDQRLEKISAGELTATTVTYRDGKETAGWRAMILPGMFLVLFFMSIVMLGNQLLTITMEEKENRVTEMVLTTIRPTPLIVGKIIAVAVLGLVQAMVFAAPGAVGLFAAWLLFRDDPRLARFTPVLEPGPLILGFLLFVAGFIVFAGVLVCIGSVMPTAKDAGGVFAGVIITLCLPLYALSAVLSDPTGPVSQVLTWFPLTSPITALLRNATGSLPTGQALLVLVILALTGAFFLGLGARLFQTGSIAYDTRLNLRKALARRTPTPEA